MAHHPTTPAFTPRLHGLGAAWLGLLCCLALPAAASADGVTTRVNVASDGTQANSYSQQPAASADGRFVVFFSQATNLVPGDTNFRLDIFVHDRLTHTTERVSVATDGTQGNGHSQYAQINADGRWVVFQSGSDNLAAGDGNWDYDVFLHDRLTHTTTLVSVNDQGVQGNSASNRPSLSADGRFISFRSRATNLVPGDTNGKWDIFVRDLATGHTERVSIATDGTQSDGDSLAATISGNGRIVAFESDATNLVEGDTNGTKDVFVHDRWTGETSLVSIALDGGPSRGGWSQVSLGNGVSSDGRWVAFFSEAYNLIKEDTNGKWDIFVRDLATRTTERVNLASDGSEGNATSIRASISRNGRFVSFTSEASNLVEGDTNGVWDIFVHDRLTGKIHRRSVSTGGAQADDNCWDVNNLDGSGQILVFMSPASNLVDGDTNGRGDIYVHERFDPAIFFDGFESGGVWVWSSPAGLASVQHP